ncbi:MAG: glycoside hydrolase family 30 protein [Pseudonocardiaceae bacterium]
MAIAVAVLLVLWVVPASASALGDPTVAGWVTSADRGRLLAPVPGLVRSRPGVRPAGTMSVALNPARRFQSIAGFGASLTESSAWLINTRLTPGARARLLEDLFDPVSGAGISYLRQPIGASDFALDDYTYDDQPAGRVDPALTEFSMRRDQTQVFPLLAQAQAVNPELRVMVSPWSPPGWMRSGDGVTAEAGRLRPEFYPAYAEYLTRVVATYRDAGLPVDAVTMQNEPAGSPPGYPAMDMSAAEQAAFAPVLAAALGRAGLSPRVLALDHNWDRVDKARAVLANPKAAAVLGGVAFHCYGGDPAEESQLPAGTAVYVSECSGGDWSPDFGASLHFAAHSLIIGALGGGARTLIFWNVALDPEHGPHHGGCAECRGVVTIDPATGKVTRNVEYYLLGQLARVVRPGAIRVATTSSDPSAIEAVGFANVNRTLAAVVYNRSGADQPVVLGTGRSQVSTTVPARSLASYSWTDLP